MPKAAIIGAGRVGSTLGGWLLQAGWQVHYGSRDPTHSHKLHEALKAQPSAHGGGIPEAVSAADIVVLAVPGGALASQRAATAFARSLGPHTSGKVLIDATNPLDSHLNELCWERGRSSAEVLQELLPDSFVYKGFNTVGVEHMAHPDGSLITGQQLTLMFAGPEEQRAEVAGLISAVGFTPCWVGGLRYSRNLEALAELYIALGAGLGGAAWGDSKGLRPYHFQVLRHSG